jgi:hypothetical protein
MMNSPMHHEHQQHQQHQQHQHGMPMPPHMMMPGFPSPFMMPGMPQPPMGMSPQVAHIAMRHHAAVNAAAGSPFSTPGRSSPMAAPMQFPVPPAAIAAATRSPAPPATVFRESRKDLKHDLAWATKEELMHVLVELSCLSSEANGFIACKAQAFALRCGAPPMDEAPPTETKASAPAMDANEEPMKHIVEMATETPKKMTSTAAATPQTPLDEINQGIHDRRVSPEKRAFCSEKHPCMWVYGSCRNPRSCVFAVCPQNLCMGFVRGHCPSGAECSLVHRMPDDASELLKHLNKVNMEREEEEAPLNFGSENEQTPQQPNRSMGAVSTGSAQ